MYYAVVMASLPIVAVQGILGQHMETDFLNAGHA
jgi:hypothetical protein